MNGIPGADETSHMTVGCVLDGPAGTQTLAGGVSQAAVCWGMEKTAAKGTFVQKFVCNLSMPAQSIAE